MGYHIIVKVSSARIESQYIETLDELLDLQGLGEDAIIYQGEKDWRPVRVKDDDRFKYYLEPWFQAGIRAQRLFGEMASANGFMIEQLNQDQNSFKSYTDNSDQPIKRGDYLVRNASGVEVEVKCKELAKYDGSPCFWMNYSDVRMHHNMMSLTSTPVLIAFFNRCDDQPDSDSLCMIEVDKILAEKGKNVSYVEKTKLGKPALTIPAHLTVAGFELLARYRSK